MADADAGPSKPPVSKTPKATYTYGNKELDAPAYAEALKSAKARGSASWWSFFTVILTEGVVKLKCAICGEVLGAKNPSATAPNHLKKHSKAAGKAQALASQEGSEAEGATPAVPSGAKRSRSYDGTPTPSMRLFMPSANQLYVFLKNLALFFYTTNIALHLIENPYLVQACAALGVTLPSRWKLATTMLDEAHAETVSEVEKECAAGEGLACIASDCVLGVALQTIRTGLLVQGAAVVGEPDSIQHGTDGNVALPSCGLRVGQVAERKSMGENPRHVTLPRKRAKTNPSAKAPSEGDGPGRAEQQVDIVPVGKWFTSGGLAGLSIHHSGQDVPAELFAAHDITQSRRLLDTFGVAVRVSKELEERIMSSGAAAAAIEFAELMGQALSREPLRGTDMGFAHGKNGDDHVTMTIGEGAQRWQAFLERPKESWGPPVAKERNGKDQEYDATSDEEDEEGKEGDAEDLVKHEASLDEGEDAFKKYTRSLELYRVLRPFRKKGTSWLNEVASGSGAGVSQVTVLVNHPGGPGDSPVRSETCRTELTPWEAGLAGFMPFTPCEILVAPYSQHAVKGYDAIMKINPQAAKAAALYAMPTYKMVHMKMKPGQIVIIHGNTVHAEAEGASVRYWNYLYWAIGGEVQMSPLGSGLTVEETIDLYCGEGEQILQWIGYAACSRLAYKRGEVYGRYVPQSVNNKDGQPLDVDIVVNEMFNDGDELFVEFSNGPVPYKVRWEGRPRTPPFRWGDGVEVVPPHDTWLRELDLKAEGLGALIEPDLMRADAAVAEKDLEKVKALLVQYAGAVQMMFLLQSADGSTNNTTSGDQLGNLTLPQFRSAMAADKVITPRFPPEKVDEIFTGVATAETTLARKVEAKSGVSTFDLLDFMLALVHLAAHRYAAENPSQAAYNHLSVKLQRRLERFSPALNNSNAMLLLRKGRKWVLVAHARALTEQTLDTCQLKRTRGAPVRVDLRWLCNHLAKWGMLGREFNLQELALIAVFAKQRSTDPETFVLHPQPLEYDYDQFERLLLGAAWTTFNNRKKAAPGGGGGGGGGGADAGGGFEEFLGETLDNVYKRAGVLVPVAVHDDGEDEDGHARGGIACSSQQDPKDAPVSSGDTTILLAMGDFRFCTTATVVSTQELIYSADSLSGAGGFGPADVVAGTLWGLSLFFASPLQQLLLFLGKIETERPSDWIIMQLARGPLGLNIIDVNEAPAWLSYIAAGICLAAGLAISFSLQAGLGDSIWALSTGTGACLAAGVYEVGRPRRLSLEEARQLDQQWRDFVTFAESRLVRSGRCHESDVAAAFRRELPRYRSREALPDAVLRDLIRTWHSDADRTPNGYYRNLSLSPRINAFTGKVEGGGGAAAAATAAAPAATVATLAGGGPRDTASTASDGDVGNQR
ncbi:hypothetical protein VOLCADRAFT_97483 [Volvox carteri f. nagariensis]|uniref:DUF7963 domain-containing protein n=1 Tax=Volvox carteri f. nagariensis TaxID=3068 RepID=D8UCV5_VOLCA|nr:uncharacterized protein VOLCADRAFT_97483 [Volvox carteri f. nagariensis]EFJ42408.1 hypothetical protein VOLCADRAFT_97483 [Volvox carteri f. nagariensis]|eukprot:XP_002956471.1 hypothetical protein VOLCADRAFT_97483 [Volvox carteri f. nagariensis]